MGKLGRWHPLGASASSACSRSLLMKEAVITITTAGCLRARPIADISRGSIATDKAWTPPSGYYHHYHYHCYHPSYGPSSRSCQFPIHSSSGSRKNSTVSSRLRRGYHSSATVNNTMAQTNGTDGKVKHNAWIGAAGAAGYDLRSDTMTTPTASMLEAIANCTLLDDVAREDPTTQDLEAHCAALTGKEAGLLVLSGTMGNQVALRTLLTQPPHAVLCDHRSHIVKYEAGGVSSLTGATVKTVVPRNGVYLTLEDVQANASLSEDDPHSCPTRVISLENTLNGMLMPLSEARRIAEFARAHKIRMHCDGARLWEAAAAGAGSLAEYAACFDTVTLCFSKGLGAPIGSILVGPRDLIHHARWVRKSIGGGLRQAGVVAAAARVGVDETFGKGPSGEGGLLRESHALARQIAGMWTALGGRLVHPPDTNMVWIDIDAVGCPASRVVELGREHGLKLWSGRLVIHYQIYQNREFVLPRLQAIFEKIMEEKKAPVEPQASASIYTQK